MNPGPPFEIPEGEVVRYLGPNGVGKSTTVKMLTGILVPRAQLFVAAPAWSPPMAVLCLLAIAGGALVEASVHLSLASPSLRMLDTAALRGFLDDVFSKFGSYPMSVSGTTRAWGADVRS